MTKNPILNALCAVLYIVVVASIIFYAPTIIKLPGEDTVFMPIWFLSLFVFSAAAMGYIFLAQPVQMFLDGEKKQATSLFLKTLAAFGVATLLLGVVGVYLSSTSGAM
jgi:hypothetical protein